MKMLVPNLQTYGTSTVIVFKLFENYENARPESSNSRNEHRHSFQTHVFLHSIVFKLSFFAFYGIQTFSFSKNRFFNVLHFSIISSFSCLQNISLLHAFQEFSFFNIFQFFRCVKYFIAPCISTVFIFNIFHILFQDFQKCSKYLKLLEHWKCPQFTNMFNVFKFPISY